MLKGIVVLELYINKACGNPLTAVIQLVCCTGQVLAHGSGNKAGVVQIKRKAATSGGGEAEPVKQPKVAAKELSLYNCSQCQCTCWGLQQLANHMVRAHGGQPNQSEGEYGKAPRKIITSTKVADPEHCFMRIRIRFLRFWFHSGSYP
jgi:hypothetical protein